MVPDPYAPLPPLTVDPGTLNIRVDSVLGTLSVREKVGQLLMPWLLGNYAAFASEEYDTLAVWVDSLGVGGLVISTGPPLEVATKLNALQTRSKLPLLVAADLEWGTGMRLVGGTAFPPPMAVAATGRALDAYELGRVTAQEARAVGIHLTFSPVADLNNNPRNPIINTRAFGEDPGAAAELIAAYIRGAAEHGLYTTAKHFPGHGDTDVDSHIELPVVRACWGRLDSLELVPFRAAVEAGVTAVMTAHVAVPCVTRDSAPATLSPAVMAGILRDSLHFDGLVVTDALEMAAVVRQYGPGESAVRAFLAGSDLLLVPADLRAARDAMVTAVENGRISTERLDRSVRRVLGLKRRAGLWGRRTVPLERVPAVVGRAEFQRTADDMAARALTLVQEGRLHAFRGSRGPVAMVAYGDETNLSVGNALAGRLRRLGDAVTKFRLYPASGPASYDSARAVIARSPRVIFATSVRVVSGRGHVAMPDSLAHLIEATPATRPTLLVSFGSPYLLSQIPGYRDGFLIAWSDVAAAERAAAEAIAGGAPISGRLPIALSSEIPRGAGIRIDAGVPGLADPAADSLPPATTARIDVERLAGVKALLDAKAAEGAFPGGVLAVGLHGQLAYLAAVGRYGEDDPRPVGDTTVYDLASLTKVIGLTTACMILVAEEKLDLDRPVQQYLPEFAGTGKELVTVRHLLTHSSGLPAWAPLYLETATREDALRRAMTMPLDTLAGARYVYSDIGAIVLGQIVERVTGEPLDRFLHRRVFQPLGMERTRYRPPESWRPAIAPTERDPWRGRVLRGEVHDENAARLDGISAHAGLFSNAPDLARFAAWLLDAWHGRLPVGARLRIPESVVREFTTSQDLPPGSTRALGWDTPAPDGSGSAGSLLSRASFGHTGFTGTSIWLDPTRDLFIVLLTNRVHPTRENRAILEVRGAVADAVVRALESGAAEPGTQP
jgi:beta-glucosidase-like glycosyl hydrolase/CubicO group peptidase (beta-lactamase class C family)